MIRVLCINDKNMPADYPNKTKWVKREHQYTVVNIKFLTQQKVIGFQLAEIDMTDCYPYTFFNANRFAIAKEDLDKLEEFVKECADKEDLYDLDMNELLADILQNQEELVDAE